MAQESAKQCICLVVNQDYHQRGAEGLHISQRCTNAAVPPLERDPIQRTTHVGVEHQICAQCIEREEGWHFHYRVVCKECYLRLAMYPYLVCGPCGNPGGQREQHRNLQRSAENMAERTERKTRNRALFISHTTPTVLRVLQSCPVLKPTPMADKIALSQIIVGYLLPRSVQV